MSFDNTQLTQASGYNTKKNMLFGKPKDGTIPNSTFSFKRIPIGTRNPDGTSGELVLLTPRVYSFGLSVNTNMNTGKPDGYTLPLCLQSRDGPTQEETDWVNTFNSIVDNCREHILSVRDEIGKYELEAADLKKLNPLYYRKEKGKVVDGSGPVLYPKILQQKKKVGKGKAPPPSSDGSDSVITTIFVDEQGNDIDPLTLLEKHCYTSAAIKIESIFVGAKVSLQVKVQEAEVSVVGGTKTRLLKRPQADSRVVMSSDITSSSSPVSNPATTSSSFQALQNDDEDDSGSVKGSDDESDPPPVTVSKTTAKAPVRRVAAKK
jgi:hypothetical protein